MGDAFVMQSAGKESIAVDARHPRIAAAIEELLSGADVLVENFRPGKLKQLGFDPARLIEKYPRLVVCSISGFGQNGADARRPAYDHVVQAMSGLMSANADEQGAPKRVGAPIIDYATGLQAALAILAAIRRRDNGALLGTPRTRGEWIDVSMRSVALTLLTPAFATFAVGGVERRRSRATAFSGNPMSGTFPTTDDYLAIVCNTPGQSRALLAALRAAGLPEDAIDALSADAASGDVERVHERLGHVLGQRSAGDWEALFVQFEVPVSRVRRPSQAYADASSDRVGWPRVTVPGLGDRSIAVPGPGFGSSERLAPPLRPPPLRGEQSRKVLRDLGFEESEIEALCREGVVRDAGSSQAS